MYEQLYSRIQQCSTIGVTSHFRPDGDAIGSTLALGLALQAMGKKVYMWNEDGVPARYAFLEGAEQILPLPEEVPADLEMLICVDTGDWKRLGDVSQRLFAEFPLIVNIDHHGTNTRYGHVQVIEPETAACAFVLFNILREWGVELTRPMADALYVGISTDTGSFQYGSTTPAVMHAAGELLAAGVDVADVNRRVYQEVPYTALLMQREVLNNMVVEADGQLAHYSMPGGRKAELGVGLEDTKDLVDVVRVLQGVRAALIFEDLEDGRIRVSLRSKDPAVNVAAIASRFGGGGHAMASGIRMRGTLEDCRAQVLAATRKELGYE
ncbi:MAG: bifunctional oligoribonuclease/PAP phosphatase NrnA [Akkermansia sp.]|nr:bifunctional oligoribonuclease/PAP phosphatase NrnA [Akkermansia sp.]MBR6576528.1 bifunctional oligoribonuclease/PAP phosphatase NrnA [Akkermansia sp.]